MDLCDDKPYAISQLVPTVVGEKYKLKFYLNQNSKCGASNKTGYVGVTGAPGTVFYYNSAEFKDWRLISYSFTAMAARTNVTIGSSTTGACGPVIDLVSLHLIEKTPPNLIINGDFELHAASHCSNAFCFLSSNKAIEPWFSSTGTFEIGNDLFLL